MTYYIVKLIILLPLMAGLIYGALWLYRKYQPGLMQVSSDRELKFVESLSLGTAGKLTLVDFAGQRVLVAVTRSQITHISSAAKDVRIGSFKTEDSFEEILNEQK